MWVFLKVSRAVITLIDIFMSSIIPVDKNNLLLFLLFSGLDKGVALIVECKDYSRSPLSPSPPLPDNCMILNTLPS